MNNFGFCSQELLKQKRVDGNCITIQRAASKECREGTVADRTAMMQTFPFFNFSVDT